MFEDHGIDENLKEKIRLLPAWFCERMVAKEGQYVLVLDGGISVALNRVTHIHQDNASRIWLDVTLMTYADAEVYLCNGGSQSRPFIAATGDQRKATINAASIMVAYEMGNRLSYEMGNG